MSPLTDYVTLQHPLITLNMANCAKAAFSLLVRGPGGNSSHWLPVVLIGATSGSKQGPADCQILEERGGEGGEEQDKTD